MVSLSDKLKARNILKLILMVRFACAALDVGHPIFTTMRNPRELDVVNQPSNDTRINRDYFIPNLLTPLCGELNPRGQAKHLKPYVVYMENSSVYMSAATQ
jgi:hypothetical protein